MVGDITNFIKTTVSRTGKSGVIVAVSGGIDSALSLTLAVRALGADNIYAVLLPFGTQDMTDARAIIDFNQLPQEHQFEVDIQPIVAEVLNATNHVKNLPPSTSALTSVREGNVMARARMIVLYDLARRLDVLVCGTENKSEKYLSYFTRFGDEASDLEPIQHLYKTEVRALAAQLELPEQIQTKAPSAGLWQDQTDEKEFGFSYEVADQVLKLIVDTQPALLERLTNGKARSLEEVRDGVRFLSGAKLELSEIEKVLSHVQQNWFKHQVPYHLYPGS